MVRLSAKKKEHLAFSPAGRLPRGFVPPEFVKLLLLLLPGSYARIDKRESSRHFGTRMEFHLYGDLGTGSAIIELALAELQLPYRVHDVALSQNLQRAGKYSAINGYGKIPSLVTPEGETLTESVAILFELSERHHPPALTPSLGSPERSQMLRWLMFAATELYPIIEMKDYPHRFVPDERPLNQTRSDELVAHFRTMWKTRWLHVEAAADPKGPWFLGSRFSMIDLYLAVMSCWGQIDNWRSKQLPRVERLRRAVSDRPGCAAIWRRHFEDRD